MSELQKAPWSKVKLAAQSAADKQGLDLGPKDLEVLAALLAF